MDVIPLKIFDETLRDGEQQAGLFFSYQIKNDLAHLIAKTGVHYIDIMPASSNIEHLLVNNLVNKGLRTVIVPATLMGRKYIDQAKSIGIERIILFHALSDRLIFLRDEQVRMSEEFSNKTIDNNISQALINKIREKVLKKIVDNLSYATSPEVNLKVEFAAEDASRSDLDFLTQCILETKPYIDHFMLCDTLGILTPEDTRSWISKIKRSTNARIAVHFHNDMGLALENTLQAIISGVSMISSTFRGIGERSGNVPCEQVLDGLRLRFGLEVEGIDYDSIDAVTNYMDKIDAHPCQPYSKESQRHETGIHVSSLLLDKKSYSPFKHDEPEIWFGKFSGSSNFKFLFENYLNMKFPKDLYHLYRDKLKEISQQQERSFSRDEIIEMYRQGKFND